MEIHKYGLSFQNNFPGFCVFYADLDFYGGDFELLLYSGQVKKKDEIEGFFRTRSLNFSTQTQTNMVKTR